LADTLQTTDGDSGFALVESILWEDCCGFWLLSEHMQKMRASAVHFGFVWDEAQVLAQLDEVVKDLSCDSIVRVELRRDGVINMSTKPASGDRSPVRASPSKQPVDPLNHFLQHSTTQRDHLVEAQQGLQHYDEVLLWNTRGEVTGSCTSNLVVEINGEYFTPPVSCGAMPGAYRASLIAEGRLTERPIRLDELALCDKVYLINSRIGWREVILS
jgi:para-aminobenzoate synthetase/4-amino-4-deoxychorismate lyase